MYNNKYNLILKKVSFLGILLTITLFSCGRDPNNPNNSKNSISLSFNNDYKGLVTDNEIIAKNDPENPDKKFINLLRSAKQTVDGAFYDIQDPDITKVFVEMKKKGVKIRLVTDTDNLTVGKKGALRDSIKSLEDAGIEIKDDKRNGLMHNKFMIVDSNYVWTGSTNLTTNSLYDHNNNSLMIESKQLSANYQAEFNRFFENGLFGVNAHEIPYPNIITTEKDSIQTFFSPGGGTTAAIIKELNDAKKSIKFMAFSFTNKEMADIMLIKNKQKIACEGIFDSCEISKYSTYSLLNKNKIPVYKDGNQALMHEKIMIIDDETVITGSFNFSNNAEHNNNENTLIIKSTNIASQFNKEYERLKFAAINNKDLPSYNHPACRGSSTDPKGNNEAGE
ncbi:MAG: hypothetical protein H7263_14605 [Candidatus Sericytochromatia bacterium]|nr:hypothetical protein [Candidatus Sericytochromatia bacterium]